MDNKKMCNSFISLIESKRFSGLIDLASTAAGMADNAMARLSVLDEIELEVIKKFKS